MADVPSNLFASNNHAAIPTTKVAGSNCPHSSLPLEESSSSAARSIASRYSRTDARFDVLGKPGNPLMRWNAGGRSRVGDANPCDCGLQDSTRLRERVVSQFD